jgi:hypothetical protein
MAINTPSIKKERVISFPNYDRGSIWLIVWAITSAIYMVLMSASLFLSAGTTDWPQTWIFIDLAIVILVLDALVLIPISPDLLRERLRYQEGAKLWDEFLSRWMAIRHTLTRFDSGSSRGFGEFSVVSPIIYLSKGV